ncbi:MAG: alpha/beta hydrolase [Bellilinea sp.]|jgi:3-oxoadipate enol-lactonase
MYVRDTGESGGFPILMLHGLGATSESWVLQFDALVRSGYRALAPDLPGFGNTPADHRGWNLGNVVGELNEYLERCNVRNCGVMGISMGGVVAQLLAATYPEKIASVILVNTFLSLRRAKLSENIYFLKRGLRAFFLSPKAQAELVARRVFPREDQEHFRRLLRDGIEKADAKVYRQSMLSLMRFEGKSLARKIIAPVLVISGENDTTIPVTMQKALVDALPYAAQVILRDAGHAANVEQPQLFNQLMLEFYSNPSESIRRYTSRSLTG